MDDINRKRIGASIALLLLAVYLGGLGIFYQHISAELFHAPRWIFLVLAILVGFGSGMAFLGQEHPLTNLFAALVWILFAAVGTWASLFSPLDTLTGGWAMFSTETNRIIARIVFGSGAILNFGAGVYAGWLYYQDQR
jgi:hypothetical protein